MADSLKSDTQVGRLAIDNKLMTLAELNLCVEERQAPAHWRANASASPRS